MMEKCISFSLAATGYSQGAKTDLAPVISGVPAGYCYWPPAFLLVNHITVGIESETEQF